MGEEGEEREKRKKENQKQKQPQNRTEPRYITSHTTHAPPDPSTFGCVLDGS